MLDFNEIVESVRTSRDKRFSWYFYLREVFLSQEEPNLLSPSIIFESNLIYFPENVIFSIIGEYPENVSEVVSYAKRFLSRYFTFSGLDIEFSNYVLWGLIYGCYGIKLYLDKGSLKVKGIPPYDLGVLLEDKSLEEPGQAIVHFFHIPKSIALKKGYYAASSEPPKTLSFVDRIISRTGDTVKGVVTPKLKPSPFVEPVKNVEYVELADVWYYDGDEWYNALVAGDKVEVRESGVFKGFSPFVLVSPNNFLTDYIWGLSELYYALPVYERLKEQSALKTHVEELMAKPPFVVAGLNLNIDAQHAQIELNKPGGILPIPNPADLLPWRPAIDPNYLMQAYELNKNELREILGISDIVLGRPVKNVRSGSYANILAMFASSNLKRKAFSIEASLEELMTKVLKVNILTSTKDDPRKFYMLVPFELYVDVYAHSSSPISQVAIQDIVLVLAEKGLIPIESVVEVLPLPDKDRIISKLIKGGE